jgi:hypothetical protein
VLCCSGESGALPSGWLLLAIGDDLNDSLFQKRNREYLQTMTTVLIIKFDELEKRMRIFETAHDHRLTLDAYSHEFPAC